MSRGARYRRWGALPLFVAIVGASLLGGCAGDGPSLPKITDLNPFKEKQQPLPGRRIPVIETTESITGNLADADKPIVLPALNANDAWPQPGGEPNNVTGNLALDGGLRQMWAADVGEGSSKTGRVTASPIVFEGRIYALDAAANVTAFSLSGSKVFSVSTRPEGQVGQGGYGGGLAAENGRLYVANGYGVVTALDPQSGKAIWTKTLGIPVRASPTAFGDRLYVITIDGRFFALSGIDGTEAWSARGLPQTASLMSSASPAVDFRRRRRSVPLRRHHGVQAVGRLDGVVGKPFAHTADVADRVDERRGAPGDRRRNGFRRRPCRPHDRDAGKNRRADLVVNDTGLAAALRGR